MTTTPLTVQDALARLADLHDGTDGLGIIVRQALADHPDATIEDIRAIVIEATDDARLEREAN